MLGQRLQRWPNIKTAVTQHLVLPARLITAVILLAAATAAATAGTQPPAPLVNNLPLSTQKWTAVFHPQHISLS